jgi:anti-sigma factor RsiW
MNTNESSDNRDLADLLPFYVTGRLPLAEMERIEAALATDEALKRELALVEEEQGATVQVNEALGLPSARSADRFLTMLEAEPQRTTPRAAAKDMFAWLGERLQSLAPRQMAFAGIAAALLLVAQAGFIGSLLHKDGGQSYGTASGQHAAFDVSLQAVIFTPDAKAADISKLLDAAKGVIIDGPSGGNLYTVRIGAPNMSKADREAAVARLGAEKGIVRLVMPYTGTSQ